MSLDSVSDIKVFYFGEPMSIDIIYLKKSQIFKKVLEAVDNVFSYADVSQEELYISLKVTGGKEALKLHISTKVSGTYYEFVDGSFEEKTCPLKKKNFSNSGGSVGEVCAPYQDVVDNFYLFFDKFRESGSLDKHISSTSITVTRDNFVTHKNYKLMSHWGIDVITELLNIYPDFEKNDFDLIKVSSSPRNVSAFYEESVRTSHALSKKIMNDFFNLLYNKGLFRVLNSDFSFVCKLVGVIDLFDIQFIESHFTKKFTRANEMIRVNDFGEAEKNDYICTVMRGLNFIGGESVFSLPEIKNLYSHFKSSSPVAENIQNSVQTKIITFNDQYWINSAYLSVYKQQKSRVFFYPIDKSSVNKLYNLIFKFVLELKKKYFGFQEIITTPELKALNGNTSYLILFDNDFKENELLEDMNSVVEALVEYTSENPVRENNLFSDFFKGEVQEKVLVALRNNLFLREMSSVAFKQIPTLEVEEFKL